MSQGPRSSADILAAHVVDLAPGEPVDLERLCDEHPDAAMELRRLTAHWDQVQAVLTAIESGQASPLAERLRRRYGDVDPGLSIDQTVSAVRPPSTGGGTLERLEASEPTDTRYETRGEIARGGMGAILEVWDVDLRRTLAMKVALNKGKGEDGASKSTDPRLLARFLEEAQITAQLDHPGIVPVHELGLDAEGKVYFTMPLVRGRDLASILELVKTGEDGWTLARALNVLLKVCEAMAYAHSKEVIHRDLKPGNIMVGRFGEVYVMDWGLAKVLGREDSRDLRLTEDRPPSSAASLSLVTTDRDALEGNPLMTMDGDVVGTPSYMSPEQARGELEAMGPASDVYSVGSILYHLLAGHMPYVPSGSKRNAFAVWGMLQDQAPDPLKKIAKGAPEELVAIATKAMDRDLARRYPHMMALGEDLRAYLEGRVVTAHATGPITELRKWVGRNKPFAATIAAALITVITIVGVTGVRQARLSETLGEKETELGAKETELAGLELEVSDGQRKLGKLQEELDADQERLALAQSQLATKEEEVTHLLGTARAESYVANVTSTALNQDAGNYAEASRRLEAAPEELRSWEWHHLALGENAALDSIPGASHVAAWANGGQDVLYGSDEGFLYQQDAATHQARNNAKVGVSTVISLSRPNASGRLACGTADGRITTWTGTATNGETWETSDQQITALAVSDDGARVFAGQGDRHHDQITGVWQSSEAASHKILVYQNDGTLLHEIEHPGGKVLALLPLQGNQLLSGGDDGRMRLWQLPTGIEDAPQEQESLDAPIKDLRVSAEPIHGLIAAGAGAVVTLAGDGIATVWDLKQGTRISSLEGHGDAILSGDVSPDGRLGATGCKDSTVAIWDTATSAQLVVLRGHRGPVRSVAFSPDGTQLLTASDADGLRVWDTGTRSAVSILRGEDHRVRQINLQRMGKDALLWALQLEKDGGPPLLLARLGQRNPAGDRIAYLGRKFKSRGRYPVGIWDLDGDPVHKLEGHTDEVRSLAWSPDGARLASASDDGSVRLWDTESGAEVAQYTIGEACLALAFSPLGDELALGRAGGAVELIDLGTGARRVLDGAHLRGVTSLAWTADGAHLASGGADAGIHIWDRGEDGLAGAPAVLLGHQELISCLLFSQDGTRLFSGSEDKTVRVWHRELRTSLLTLRGLLFPVQGLALSRGDRRLITWEGTGVPLARVWDSSVDDAGEMWRERANAQQAAQILQNLQAMFPAQEDLRMVLDSEEMPDEVRAICEVLLERSTE